MQQQVVALSRNMTARSRIASMRNCNFFTKRQSSHALDFQSKIARMAPSSRDLLEKIPIELAFEESLLHAPTSRQKYDVPVIDLSESDEKCSKHIWQACKEIGFFKLKNHGIPNSDIEEMFQQNEKFMALPQELKEARCPHNRDEIRGYEYKKQVHPSTGIPDEKENLLIPSRAGAMDGMWPNTLDGLPEFATRTQSFMARCHGLSLRIVGMLEARLGMEPGFFSRTHTMWNPRSKCVYRMLHYPPIHDVANAKANAWRCGAHTDFGTFTLLFQRPGETGLECAANPQSHRSDGVIRYTPVDPEPGTISCNIGDMLMKMSDDQLLSNLHRVRMPQVDSTPCSRYSMAFFLQPDQGTMIQSNKYGTHTAEDLMRARCHAYWNSE